MHVSVVKVVKPTCLPFN